MSRTVSATEARVHLGELLDDIEHNGTITVEHAGKVETVVVPADEAHALTSTTAGGPNRGRPLAHARAGVRKDREDRNGPITDMSHQGRASIPYVIQPEEGDWKEALARVRGRMQVELGGKPIDFDQIIHDMREERSAELIDNLRRRKSRRQAD